MTHSAELHIVKPDEQIVGLPRCTTAGCHGRAWIYFGGGMRCSECVEKARLESNRQEEMLITGGAGKIEEHQ